MEASRLKKIVSECDPHAFVTVCDVHEALGEGFSYHPVSYTHLDVYKRQVVTRGSQRAAHGVKRFHALPGKLALPR